MRVQAHLPLHTAPELCRLSSSFLRGALQKRMAYQGRGEGLWGMRPQAHLPVHTAPELCRLSSFFEVLYRNVWLIRDGGKDYGE